MNDNPQLAEEAVREANNPAYWEARSEKLFESHMRQAKLYIAAQMKEFDKNFAAKAKTLKTDNRKEITAKRTDFTRDIQIDIKVVQPDIDANIINNEHPTKATRLFKSNSIIPTTAI